MRYLPAVAINRWQRCITSCEVLSHQCYCPTFSKLMTTVDDNLRMELSYRAAYPLHDVTTVSHDVFVIFCKKIVVCWYVKACFRCAIELTKGEIYKLSTSYMPSRFHCSCWDNVTHTKVLHHSAGHLHAFKSHQKTHNRTNDSGLVSKTSVQFNYRTTLWLHSRSWVWIMQITTRWWW